MLVLLPLEWNPRGWRFLLDCTPPGRPSRTNKIRNYVDSWFDTFLESFFRIKRISGSSFYSSPCLSFEFYSFVATSPPHRESRY
jgi:hypothetical protein